MPNGVPATVKVLPEMWTKSEAGTVAEPPCVAVFIPDPCPSQAKFCPDLGHLLRRAAGGEGACTCGDYEIQIGSTTAAMAPLRVREITIVAPFGPANLSRLRSSAGSTSTPRFLISKTPMWSRRTH